MTTEAETGMSGRKPRNAGGHWKLEEARNRISPWNFQKTWDPAGTLIPESVKLNFGFLVFRTMRK